MKPLRYVSGFSSKPMKFRRDLDKKWRFWSEKGDFLDDVTNVAELLKADM